MNLRLYVGKCDVKNADYTANEDCPIARALKRKFPKQHIFVFPESVTIGKKDYNLIGGGAENVCSHIRNCTPFRVRIKS